MDSSRYSTPLSTNSDSKSPPYAQIDGKVDDSSMQEATATAVLAVTSSPGNDEIRNEGSISDVHQPLRSSAVDGAAPYVMLQSFDSF